MIDSADSVIVFLTDKATPQVRKELSYALTKNIPVIPIVERGAVTAPVQTILRNKNVPVFTMEPGNPWGIENKLAEYLRKKKYDKDTRNAILALAGTFIGLFLLNRLADT
jgi:nucleoside 2-deoxyribosyltransferase